MCDRTASQWSMPPPHRRPALEDNHLALALQAEESPAMGTCGLDGERLPRRLRIPAVGDGAAEPSEPACDRGLQIRAEGEVAAVIERRLEKAEGIRAVVGAAVVGLQ